jgi:transposase
MAGKEKYGFYLSNSEFIKYGIVVSHLVWGKSYYQIGEAFEVSKPYVSKVLKRWREDENFQDKRLNNGGSNMKISKRKEDMIREIIEEDRASSVRQLAKELETEFKFTFNHQTVANSLKNNGFKKSLPIKVPLLTPNALEKRMEYAELHLENKFTNVVFTDETMFQLSENRQLSWWNPDYEDKPVFEENHNKRKVMIWAGISRRGKTDVFYWKISEDLTVDAYEYTKCLNQALIGKMDSLYGFRKWRLMQDNARPHTAQHTKDFLEENDIRTITHPPYSPDLNPIELVWAYLKKKIMTKVYNNLDEVLERVFEEWYSISQEMINNLIDRHMARVQEVYNLNGGFI